MTDIKDFYVKFFTSEIANGFSRLITDQYFSFFDSFLDAGLIQPNSNQSKMIDALKTISAGDLSSSTNLFHHSYPSQLFKDEDYKSGYISFADLNQKINRIKDDSKQAKILLRLNNSEYHHNFIDDYANSVNQIKFHRNQHAHNKVQFLGKAKVIQLYGEIYHLLQITEDKHKEQYNDLSKLEKFLDDFESQISFDINEHRKNEIVENKEDPLLNKIDDIYGALSREIRFVKGELEEFVQNIEITKDKTLQSTDTNVARSISVRPEGMDLNDGSDSKKDIQVQKNNLANNVLANFIKESDISKEEKDSPVEEIHCVEKNTDIPESSLNVDSFMQKLTISQTRELLIELRDKIRNDMRRIDPNFENWENILSKPIIDKILKDKISTKIDFLDNTFIRKYYERHKDVMDNQLSIYWDSIQDILGRSLQKHEIILNRNNEPWAASTFGAKGTYLSELYIQIENFSDQEKEKYKRFEPTLTDSLLKKFLDVCISNPKNTVTIEKVFKPKEGYYIKKI
tara:strand:- start:359 stop:1897 length:1539 start_codon:yes stop_codon:yes gene_type:complete